MKNLKVLLLVAILGVASAVQARPNNSDYNTVINAFIESKLHTDYKTMKTILSPEAVEKLPREKAVYKATASDLLRTMKVNNGIEQSCTAEHKVLAESDGMIMVQIDFNYDQHTISEFITLERNKGLEWKVTSINKFFKNVATADKVNS